MNVLKGAKEIRKFYEDYKKYHIETYGIIPTSKQLEVLESKDKIIEITFGRREGCSTAAMMKAIEYAINNQGSRVIFVTSSNVITRVRHHEITEFFKRDRLSRHLLISTRNPFNIELINGSRISLFSFRQADSLRGIAADCLIIDGRRYISDYEFQCAMCCTLHKDDTQVVILDQVDLINGQPINI